ncbi:MULTISPECIES: DUF2510 domain-containing protein [unclassified Rathayibacter]|uniref:DUF2510 domain-containing protein n=1 Tax=unclassified Rathayibacter TaxID=2609250 RepID=UPI00188AF069|nr:MULTISPECIES: DUF2510 domain-containing protein [unclassified Rathayibacter]MBF4462477.1 DUF2510 domain-containing protein [Rathayibacter sp. VKM Ac-2879]MBF4503480.1 DUF2510 domain-containing protein [Rathayibacter sp. VKM Ac-2878]
MPDDSAATPAPGWYPDPGAVETLGGRGHDGTERYWDGTAWTDRSRPATVPAYGTPQSAPSDAAELYAYPSAPSSAASRNPLAIASLVLGLVSLLFNPILVPSILAIAFGVRGRRSAAQLGGGGGLAIGGLVTGIVGAVTGIISILAGLSGLSG